MAKNKKSPVAASLHTLIKVYTKQRDWFMVERLFNDLGRLYEEKTS